MPSVNDQEDSKVPAGLPPFIDAHVHIFPSSIFSSIRKWFDENAWHIRYQMTSSQIFEFLLSRGIKHIIALQYAHKPGIAKQLNKYMAGKCREYNHRVTGMATVFPGENDAENILIDFPNLKICVPHLGFDEISAYREMIEKYNNLWLDTTMAITDYFSIEEKIALNHYRSERIMYGSGHHRCFHSLRQWACRCIYLQPICIAELIYVP